MAASETMELVINARDNASRALSGIGDSLSNLGSRCKALGSTLTLGLTAPLVAVGGGAIKMAADFETAMNNVNSIAFLPQAQLKALGQSVIDLSKTVPQGPEVLAKALYDIYSSGFQGKEALDVLNSSAQAASAGMTDAFTSGKALMAVINSYPKGMYDAKTASDLLFQTVNLGVLTFEELASQIGDVLPTAATTGVSLKEIGAALATMTRGGISAAESVTALNQMLLSYIDPSDEAIGLANKLGIEFNVQAIQAKGLAGVMNDLASKVGLYEVVSTGADAAIKAQVTSIKEQILALDQQAAALGPPTKANKALRDAISDQKEALNLQRRELLMAKDANIDYNVVLAEMSKRTGLQAEQLAILFPNVRALKAALSLTREEGAVFNEMLVGMGAATEGAGATQKALAEQAKSTAFQFEILKNNVQALGIQVGSVLLPPLNQLMGMLTPIVQKVAETAKAFLEAHPQVGAIALAIGGLVAAAGPVLMIFGTLATVVGALLSPLGLLVGVVVGLAAAWMTNFGGIRDAVQGAWSAIEPIFKLIISFIGELVKAFQSGGLQGALTTWEALWPKFSAAVTGWIGPVIPTLLAKLGELASRMLSWVAEQISPLLAQLAKWGQQFVDWIGPKIPPLLAELAKLAGQLLSWVASQIPPLLAQLAKWGQQFVDWIGPKIPPLLAELAKLAGQVLSWIAARVPEVIAQLAKWGQQFVDWIGPKIPPLLAELGKLASRVLSWLGEKVPELVAQLLRWGQKFFEWVAPQIPPLIMELGKLLGRLLEWVLGTAVPEAIKALVRLALAFVDWVATEAIPRIVPALADLLGSILGWIVNDAVPAALGAAVGIGESIIRGVIQGVGNLVGSLISAVTGAIGQAVQAAWGAIQGHSPSAVFAEMGLSMMQGLAQGVQAGSPEALQALIDVLSTLKAESIEGVGKIASSLADLLRNVREIAEALSTEMPAVKLAVKPLLDALRQISQDVQDWIGAGGGAFAENFEKNVLPKLESFVKSIGPIRELLDTGRSILEAAAAPLPELVRSMQTFLHNLAVLMTDVGNWITERQAQFDAGIRWFALEIRPRLQQWAESIKPLADLLQTTKGILEVAAAEIPELKRQVETFLFNLAVIMTDVGNWIASRQAQFDAGIKWFSEEIAPRLQSWADSLAPLQSLLQTARGVLELAAAEVGAVKLSVDRLFYVLIQLMADIFDAMRKWNPRYAIDAFATEMTPWLAKWNEALQPVQGLLQTAKGLLDVAAGEVGEVKLSVDRLFYVLIQLMADIFDAMRKWNPRYAIDAFAAEMTPWLEKWNAAIAPIQPLLQTAKDILDLAASDAGQTQISVATLFDNLQQVMAAMGNLATSLQAQAETFTAEGMAKVAAFAEMIKAVGEALKASIQPLIDLANYGSTPQAAIDSFFADLSYVLTKTAAEAARWEATALTAAEGLAETAQKVGKALQAAAVGLSAGEKGIGAYEAIDRATVDAFFADLDYVVQKTIVTAALFTAQGLSAALDFALTAQEIGKALKDTAGGLKKVLDEVGADFQEKISAFLGGVAAIVQAVVTAATQGGQALASARDLAAHMAGIVSIITQAAADFARLAGSLGGGTSYDLGMGVGAGFISGIIAGINSLLPDLGAVLAYLASLFPHSPAERGPLAEPVDWQSYLTGGLSDALAGLRGDLTPALIPVTGGDMGGGRSSGGQVININISGNNFRDRSDIDYTLDAMTRKLRLQGVIP